MSWINLAVAVLGWRIRCARKTAVSAPDAHGTLFRDESKHVYRHPPRLTYRTFERSLCRIEPNPCLVFCSECRCAMPSIDGLFPPVPPGRSTMPNFCLDRSKSMSLLGARFAMRSAAKTVRSGLPDKPRPRGGSFLHKKLIYCFKDFSPSFFVFAARINRVEILDRFKHRAVLQREGLIRI